ncbi:MAG: hypothetical protein WC107_04920 [Patescibacteria group bacterium]
MDSKSPLSLSFQAEKLISDFFAALEIEKNLHHDNDKTVSSALIYEKIRVALEYQEEHLILKNAIARILRRRYALALHNNVNQMTNDLINELAWSNYLNPELLKEQDIVKIKEIIGRNTLILKHAISKRFKRHELQKIILDWAACEIEEYLKPSRENDVFIDYAFRIYNKNLIIDGSSQTPEQSAIQLKSVIYQLLLKPDLPLIQFWLIKQGIPAWFSSDSEEIIKIAKSFDPYFNIIERVLNHHLRPRYVTFVKRYIAPFVLLRQVLLSKGTTLDNIKNNPRILEAMVIERYQMVVEAGRRKVWRGTYRALIFIICTKISLAFLLEIPFDKYIAGEINLVSLIINVSLPPFLMLVSGTFVKSPPKKNVKNVSAVTTSIITSDQIEDKPFRLVPQVAGGFEIFNIIYILFTLGILGVVIWLLLSLDFNILSIILFFFFVSVVSFFSFRIRNIALELAMKRSKDDAITSMMEFLLLPFIRIGKFFSDKFTAFNPFIIALDFIIEAPLKTIIKIMNSWLKFINAKKEELEL